MTSRSRRLRLLAAVVTLGVWVPLLSACGPLVTPASGPNSDDFPPEYALVVWSAELADSQTRRLAIEVDQLVRAGAVDGIRVEGADVVIEGWAPIPDAGILWVVGMRGVRAHIASVEARWRPDVAVAFSDELVGSGFSVRVDDAGYAAGDPFCVVAQRGTDWILLTGSHESQCGLSDGERG